MVAIVAIPIFTVSFGAVKNCYGITLHNTESSVCGIDGAVPQNHGKVKVSQNRGKTAVR